MYVEEKKPGETEIDEAGKILLDAADYIERHGWCQGAHENGQGEVCAMAAIYHCYRRGDLTAMRRLQNYVGSRYVGDWNDAPGRTKEQVVEALRAAARTPVIDHGRSTLGLRKWLGFGIRA